eukprot:518745-Rhodomonas_salina.8
MPGAHKADGAARNASLQSRSRRSSDMGSVAESAQSKGSADSYEFCECAQCTEWISKYHVLQQEVRSRRFPPCLSCMLLAKSIYGVAVEMVRTGPAQVEEHTEEHDRVRLGHCACVGRQLARNRRDLGAFCRRRSGEPGTCPTQAAWHSIRISGGSDKKNLMKSVRMQMVIETLLEPVGYQVGRAA